MTQRWLVTLIPIVPYVPVANRPPKGEKTIGGCPLGGHYLCTDVQGRHHTMIVNAENIYSIIAHFANEGVHVTRIELVGQELTI